LLPSFSPVVGVLAFEAESTRSFSRSVIEQWWITACEPSNAPGTSTGSWLPFVPKIIIASII
jgi:hypothetical protein